jgi:M6 family metalloprotease-like protein
MLRNIVKRLLISAAAVLAVSAGAASVSATASADWVQAGVIGDLNKDGELNVADLVLMNKLLLGQQSYTHEDTIITGSDFISIDGTDPFIVDEGYLIPADLNFDYRVDGFDLAIMRKCAVLNYSPVVWRYQQETVTTTTSSATTSYVTTTSFVTTTSVTTTSSVTTSAVTTSGGSSFISPPLYDLYGSMPSQGDSKIMVFYVDFPDCRYDYEPSMEEVENAVFGPENPKDSNYPFESVSAFYNRSSKGAVQLSGKAFRYTAKESKSAYEGDVWHVKLIDEIVAETDGYIDYSQFDGDKDRGVDAILINVPKAAGDDNWWPAAGEYKYHDWLWADRTAIRHVIVGNAQIDSARDHREFCSTYLHELGHCMGLPDLYLYDHYENNDQSGLRGSAGYELMDDVYADLSAASKLMLGWYTEDQIQVFDGSQASATFTLNSGQGSQSNCVIIPRYGETGDRYRTEFFIVEYVTTKANNSYLPKRFWWLKTGSGVRVIHVDAACNNYGYYDYWQYASGRDDQTYNNAGRRFMRIIDDVEKDNLYRTGSTIDSSISGFKWYDQSGGQTVDPGITINVGALENDSYTITISKK